MIQVLYNQIYISQHTKLSFIIFILPNQAFYLSKYTMPLKKYADLQAFKN